MVKQEVINSIQKDLRARNAEELTEEKIEYFVNETKKWIGKEIELDDNDKYLAEQPVEPSEIRRFTLLNRYPNPLWVDRKYAKTTMWKDVIAPPLFIDSSCASHIGGTVPVQIPGLLQAQHWLHAGLDFEFFNPVRPGDLIKPRVFFDDIKVKTGNFVGQMFLNSTKTIFKNRLGEVLAIAKNYDMMYPVQKAQSVGYYKISRKQAIPPLQRVDLGRWNITRRGAHPLYYEDVNIGDELPSITNSFAVMDIVAQGASIRTGIEYPQERGGLGCHWHYHPVTCFKVRALPVPFDFGRYRYTWGSRLVTDWMGDNGWVQRLNLQSRRPVFAGDALVIKGKITDKCVRDDRHFVTIDIWYENQRNEVPCKGNATVILPSRTRETSILPKAPKV